MKMMTYNNSITSPILSDDDDDDDDDYDYDSDNNDNDNDDDDDGVVMMVVMMIYLCSSHPCQLPMRKTRHPP